MKQLGYEGALLQRQDDYGLTTFWDTSMFQLVAQKHALLHDLAETRLQVDMCIICRSGSLAMFSNRISTSAQLLWRGPCNIAQLK